MDATADTRRDGGDLAPCRRRHTHFLPQSYHDALKRAESTIPTALAACRGGLIASLLRVPDAAQPS